MKRDNTLNSTELRALLATLYAQPTIPESVSAASMMAAHDKLVASLRDLNKRERVTQSEFRTDCKFAAGVFVAVFTILACYHAILA